MSSDHLYCTVCKAPKTARQITSIRCPRCDQGKMRSRESLRDRINPTMIPKSVLIVLGCCLALIVIIPVTINEHTYNQGVADGIRQAEARQDWVIGRMGQMGVLKWCDIYQRKLSE